MNSESQDHQLSFSAILDDFAETQRLLARKRSGPHAMLKWCACLGLLTLLLVLTVNRNFEFRLLASMISSLLFMAILSAIVLWLMPALLRSQLAYYWGPGPFLVSVELDETQLIYRFSDIEYRFGWKSVKELERHSTELRVFIGNYALVRLPLRHFDSPRQEDEWVHFIEQKSGRAFVSS
jgi:hypothetical protein